MLIGDNDLRRSANVPIVGISAHRDKDLQRLPLHVWRVPQSLEPSDKAIPSASPSAPKKVNAIYVVMTANGVVLPYLAAVISEELEGLEARSPP